MLHLLIDRLVDATGSSILELALGSSVSAIVFFHGWLEWRRAKFDGRINFSLNTLQGNTLLIRTILEDDVKNVILSPYARRLLKKAAKKTTIEDPFLPLVEREHSWMVYNEIINAISGIYGAQILSAALHETGMNEETFYIMATWERDADVRIQKLRVLVIKKTVLVEIALRYASIKPEIKNQQSRIDTLKKMHDEWLTHSRLTKDQILRLPR